MIIKLRYNTHLLIGWMAEWLRSACKAVYPFDSDSAYQGNDIRMTQTKALFLDRDGVINHDNAYAHKKEDFHF